jgi:hypothetical protein
VFLLLLFCAVFDDRGADHHHAEPTNVARDARLGKLFVHDELIDDRHVRAAVGFWPRRRNPALWRLRGRAIP